MASFRRAVTTVSRILNATHTTNRTFISPFLSSPIRTRDYACWFSRYSTLNNCDSASVSIDLSNEESKRRLFNRLLYRSRQRGFLELDLVLGKWVEEHIHSMDENKIKALVDVLDMENPDLWKWLTGQEQPPDGVCQNPVLCEIRDKVMNNLNSHSAAETRAVPGQPWVRGWDDIKKSAGAPVAGNQ
ncbi:Succinate dehydrogenase assembly factor 2, mitochondrial [Linum perenne]